MTTKMKQTFKVTVLAAALLAVYGSALAEGLVLDPNSVSIGIGNWSNDRYQRGIFDGMRESGAYGLVDADISKRDDATGTWLGLKARNLGLDNREIKGEWLRQGDIGASLEYSGIPRVFPYDYNTGLLGIGTATQTVVNIAPGTGSNWELGTKRDRFTAKFVKHFGTNLKLNASFRNEEKDGTRPYGRGGSSEFSVEPVNSTIRLFDATLSYSRDRLQLSGGYYGSSYSTANTLITSFGTVTNQGSTTFYVSQPMDNMAHELFLNGGYSFTPTTRGTFKLSYSRATQDEALPTAFIPGLADPRAPAVLDGKIETTMIELGLNARPMPKLSIVGNLRYRDFADKTPLRQYIFDLTPPITNDGWNTPWSYTDKIGKLEATYRMAQGYSVLGGIEIKSQDRTAPTPGLGYIRVPFVKQLDKSAYRLQLRKSMSETVNGTLAYVREDRTGKDYVAAQDQAQNPLADPSENLIHPMHIADRTRDKVRAMLDWSPLAKLNVQFAVEDSRDKYGNGPNGNPLGIQKGAGSLYSADASYQLTSDMAVNAWISRDESKADEITVGAGGDPERKYNTLKETGTSFGVGVKGKVSDRLKVGLSAEQFRSKNVYIQTLVGTTLSTSLVPTPDITNKLLRVKLFATYAMQKNSELRFDLTHERYTTNDWSWTMFPASGPTPFAYCGTACGGADTDGTTVLADQKQNSTFVGIRYIYKFQ